MHVRGAYMRKIQSIKDLNIPAKYQTYILEYLQNISDIPFVSRVILFGSCARETVSRFSDIDIFITVNRPVTEEEEFLLMADRLPKYIPDTSVSTDIIVQPESVFNKYMGTFGMVQKQVNNYGVDLSGLLLQRTTG